MLSTLPTHKATEGRHLISRWLTALLLVSCLGGCAIITTHSDGTRTVAGFVSLTLPAPSANSSDLSSWMRAQSVGVALMHSETGAVLSVGWVDATMAFARGSACFAVDARR